MYLQPRRAIINQQRWEREFEKYFQGGCYDNKTKPQSGKSMTCKERSELHYVIRQLCYMLHVICYLCYMCTCVIYVICCVCYVIYVLICTHVICYL